MTDGLLILDKFKILSNTCHIALTFTVPLTACPSTPSANHLDAMPVNHYENFPVASLLCPPHLRPAIVAIYHFARTADDLADEGLQEAAVRLGDLQAYRADLLAVADGQANSQRWPQVFVPLQLALQTHKLPVKLLTDLLDAFEQDVHYTAIQRRYQSESELLDYCSSSANPVGRLLLHMYGITDTTLLKQSDQICTALQLINFWQDVSVDAARGRWYICQDAMTQFNVSDTDFSPHSHSSDASRLIAAYTSSAKHMMLNGLQLPLHIPGRAGWELRLVVQGGLRILDKIERLGFATWRERPKLNHWDLPVMLWRALRMG
jgi:squalene synthase HpnC